jgi:hypothetical protein
LTDTCAGEYAEIQKISREIGECLHDETGCVAGGTVMTRAKYPPGFEQDLADDEFQCCYCGRFMDDRKHARGVRYEGWKLHTCLMCQAVLSVGRQPLTMAGRQRRVQKVLKIVRDNRPDYRMYVGMDGLAVSRLKKGLR